MPWVLWVLFGYAVADFVLGMMLGRCVLPGLRCRACVKLRRQGSRLGAVLPVVLVFGCGIDHQHWAAPAPLDVQVAEGVGDCWRHGLAAAEASLNALVLDTGGERPAMRLRAVGPAAAPAPGHILVVEGPLAQQQAPEGAVVDEAGWAQLLLVGNRIIGAKLTLSSDHCASGNRYRIASHELGHAYGLPHRPERDVVMHSVAYPEPVRWHAESIVHILEQQ